ncbi:MAG: sporulation-induced protein, partial [Marteilia pararefringens]
MNYPYFLDPPIDNNRISELLKDKQVTVKQLIEDSQFLSYYQTGAEELHNFINKEQSISEIIEIISEAARAPVYFENEPIYMDNIEMYEERTKHLHIISEIFYANMPPFCQIFFSHTKSLVKLFECFKLEINPLVGGLLYKIIKSLCQCDPEKFAEHIFENKWILNDLLGHIKNQFALDILVQITHSSVKFVELAKDQKLAENLLLIIISNCESVSTQKQENCIEMYDALIYASLELLASENSPELLEYLT